MWAKIAEVIKKKGEKAWWDTNQVLCKRSHWAVDEKPLKGRIVKTKDVGAVAVNLK